MHTYIHIYMHTCIYIHTCIHIQIYKYIQVLCDGSQIDKLFTGDFFGEIALTVSQATKKNASQKQKIVSPSEKSPP